MTEDFKRQIITNAIKEVERLKDKSEYRCVTFRGIKNLSRSDLDEILFRLSVYLRTGDVSGCGEFMKPYGGIADALEKVLEVLGETVYT